MNLVKSWLLFWNNYPTILLDWVLKFYSDTKGFKKCAIRLSQNCQYFVLQTKVNHVSSTSSFSSTFSAKRGPHERCIRHRQYRVIASDIRVSDMSYGPLAAKATTCQTSPIKYANRRPMYMYVCMWGDARGAPRPYTLGRRASEASPLSSPETRPSSLARHLTGEVPLLSKNIEAGF